MHGVGYIGLREDVWWRSTGGMCKGFGDACEGFFLPPLLRPTILAMIVASLAEDKIYSTVFIHFCTLLYLLFRIDGI